VVTTRCVRSRVRPRGDVLWVRETAGDPADALEFRLAVALSPPDAPTPDARRPSHGPPTPLLGPPTSRIKPPTSKKFLPRGARLGGRGGGGRRGGEKGRRRGGEKGEGGERGERRPADGPTLESQRFHGRRRPGDPLAARRRSVGSGRPPENKASERRTAISLERLVFPGRRRTPGDAVRSIEGGWVPSGRQGAAAG
jgi:hypothetical protein